MKRIEGGKGVKPIELTNPVRDLWRVRWDVRAKDDGSADYMEEEFKGRPSVDAIRAMVTAWVNRQVDERIVSGFAWNGVPVWLSTENQFNFKAAFDLAVQTGGATLPVTFKLGTDADPVYQTFDTLDGLRAFYTAAMAHIQAALADGWRRKDSVNWAVYA